MLTLLKLLQTLESDLKLVVIRELGGIVEDIDPEKRDGRHGGIGVVVDVEI